MTTKTIKSYLDFDISPNLGFIRSKNQRGAEGFLYIIIETWGNSGFSKNESLILERLINRKKIKKFYYEGSFQTINSSYLKQLFQSKGITESDMLAGKIKPIEYLASSIKEDSINGELELIGVDNESFYKEQETAYKASVELKPLTEKFIKKVQSELLRIRNKCYPSDWNKIYTMLLDDHRTGSTENPKNLTLLISQFAKKQSIDNRSNPKFSQLCMLYEKEESFSKNEIKDAVLGLYKDILHILDNEDPDEGILLNVLNYQMNSENRSSDDILNLTLDEMEATYQHATKNHASVMERALSALPNEGIKFPDFLCLFADIATVLNIDLSHYTSKRSIKRVLALFRKIRFFNIPGQQSFHVINRISIR